MKVPAKYLRAALITAADRDIRHYLNGVFIISDGTHGRVVSTDGHRASVFRFNCQEISAGVIVPRSAIEALPLAKATGDVDVQIGALLLGPSSIAYEPISGQYPDYARIFPKETSGEAAQFNPEYLMDFTKIAKLVTSRRNPFIRVEQNGTGAAVVTCGDANFVGVLMPHRDTDKVNPVQKYDGWV